MSILVGISVAHLLVFPEGSGNSSNSSIMGFLQATAGLSLDYDGNCYYFLAPSLLQVVFQSEATASISDPPNAVLSGTDTEG